MGNKLYVGNLPYSADEETIRTTFEQDGRQVTNVNIITDRETGRPRGFAFVEMASDRDAKSAIEQLDGTMFGDRTLTVNEARERTPRAGGGGGGGHGGGGSRGGRGGGGGGRYRDY